MIAIFVNLRKAVVFIGEVLIGEAASAGFLKIQGVCGLVIVFKVAQFNVPEFLIKI